ncbi:MAG: mannose-6-phosphate isomerase, class I [Corynebacterium sp.]|uniref:mannose-6-phosphate isomerase, class I n=1 Tax=Corynebacterium sp. TaxID=1720 RepID=UPI0026DD9FD4|nr:mannose-6-phosphate isomerase, class I [Corynebacterium sp.]MDO5097601.1 mannose-6-phosphate isomerase, class I [Corynebacterium sp.]
MLLLRPRTQTYPWGSKDLIAGLRGRTAASHPEAELWYGAHPGGSATVDNRSLTAIIAADPEYHLGASVRQKYGDRLPFLLKILAAAEPLSLQAHPSLDQAKEGFARENDAGIDVRAPHRNYKDDNHKPELIVALTKFHAMAGFRPLARTHELFDALGCPTLDRWVGIAEGEGSETDHLRALFTTWISIPATVRKELIDDIVAAARRVVDTSEREATGSKSWIIDTLRNIIELDARYPGDVGVLGALLLNYVVIEPGEAVFLHAGNLHAYCRGLGVEIMANSDNVLRGGLTSKHVDVPELVRVLDFRAVSDPRIESTGGWFRTPAEEFALAKLDVDGTAELSCRGPRIALCTAGEVSVAVGDATAQLNPTQAVWIAAGESEHITVSGRGQLFIATVNE